MQIRVANVKCHRGPPVQSPTMLCITEDNPSTHIGLIASMVASSI